MTTTTTLPDDPAPDSPAAATGRPGGLWGHLAHGFLSMFGGAFDPGQSPTMLDTIDDQIDQPFFGLFGE